MSNVLQTKYCLARSKSRASCFSCNSIDHGKGAKLYGCTSFVDLIVIMAWMLPLYVLLSFGTLNFAPQSVQEGWQYRHRRSVLLKCWEYQPYIGNIGTNHPTIVMLFSVKPCGSCDSKKLIQAT